MITGDTEGTGRVSRPVGSSGVGADGGGGGGGGAAARRSAKVATKNPCTTDGSACGAKTFGVSGENASG